MKNLLSPYWALAVVVLPHFILFSLFAGSYHIIKSLLTPENLSLWWKFGLTLSAMTVSSLFYAVFCLANKRNLHTGFGVLVLWAHGLFMVTFLMNAEYIIPRNIPAWMFLSGDLDIFVYTFLMPACVYGLFLMVMHFTPKVYETNIFMNFLWVLLIPMGCYILISGLPTLSMGNGITAKIFQHLTVIFVMCFIVAFLFFLTRFFYVLAVRQDTFFREARMFCLFAFVGFVSEQSTIQLHIWRFFARLFLWHSVVQWAIILLACLRASICAFGVVCFAECGICVYSLFFRGIFALFAPFASRYVCIWCGCIDVDAFGEFYYTSTNFDRGLCLFALSLA
jgi:hypothetical protein